MNSEISISWVQRSPNAREDTTWIWISHLPVPFLLFRDSILSWQQDGERSMLARYISRIIMETDQDQISASLLAEITGIKAQFWRPILLEIEQRGFIELFETKLSVERNITNYRIERSESGNLENAIKTLETHREARSVIFLPETGDLVVSTDAPDDDSSNFISAFSGKVPISFSWPAPDRFKRRNLSALVSELANEHSHKSLDQEGKKYRFRINGQMPALVPVAIASGIIANPSTGPNPILTSFRYPNGSLKRINRRINLSIAQNLHQQVLAALTYCASDEVVAQIRSSAPSEALRNLKVEDPFSWKVSTADGLTQSVKVDLPEVSFVIHPAADPSASPVVESSLEPDSTIYAG